MRNEEFIKCYLIEAIGTIGAIRLIGAIYIFIRRLIVHCALCIVQR